MKRIPNCLTVLRILLSPVIFFTKPSSLLFWVIYSICGISDLLDGYIARKINTASRLGATLDSIADLIFISAVFIVFLPVISVPTKILVWIVFIILVRIVSLLVGYYKYHTFAALHTYLNKATGIFLFCFLFFYDSIQTGLLTCVLCAVASVSAIEEFYINIKSRELNRNIKGVFDKGFMYSVNNNETFHK